jgi:hypothetical protein
MVCTKRCIILVAMVASLLDPCRGDENVSNESNSSNDTTGSNDAAATSNTNTAAAAAVTSNTTAAVTSNTTADNTPAAATVTVAAVTSNTNTTADTTANTTTDTNTTAAATTIEVERHVVEGKMGINFGSRRRLEGADEDFVALARQLLTVAQVKPHIQVGLQETIHKDTKVTVCDKQGATDVFHVTYQIPCATAAEAASATTLLGKVSSAGATFDALKAAVTKSAKAASITLVIKSPPTELVAPTTAVKKVTVAAATATTTAAATTNATTTTGVNTIASGASRAEVAMGALMGLAMLAAAAN